MIFTAYYRVRNNFVQLNSNFYRFFYCIKLMKHSILKCGMISATDISIMIFTADISGMISQKI